MVEITDIKNSSSVKLTEIAKENFQGSGKKSFKTAEFFEYLYTYPPKVKVKWDELDELHDDLLVSHNYGVLEHSFPFMDYIHHWLFRSTPSTALTQEYTREDLKKAFLDRRYSSNFYSKETKEIQTNLASIPVFVILNGYKEIALTKPENLYRSKDLTGYFKQVAYSISGVSDTYTEKRKSLGFFFFNKEDAQKQLEEIAKTDGSGTNLLGLSIHCIGLDSAYQVTREHHPDVDFRFVPNLKDLKTLLTQQLRSRYLIVDETQHQLRFRPRSVNMFPYLGKLGSIISPKTSFLQRSEYFKGVPIYVVQVTNKPRNIIFEQYFQVIGFMDSAWGRFIQYFDNIIGFGHNWIMQGSLVEAGTTDRFTNYVFFNKEQAQNFVKAKGRSVARYSGSRTSNVEFFVRKPKIYIHNLEDFLELWEDRITNRPRRYKSAVYAGKTYFVAPQETFDEVNELEALSKQNKLVSNVKQTLNIKYRKFKSFLDIFFGVSYFT